VIAAKVCTRTKVTLAPAILLVRAAEQAHHFFLLLEDLAGCEAPAVDASSAAAALALLELLLGIAVEGPASSASSTSSALTPFRFFLEERSADGADGIS
jgi:hypothetical protein